MTYNATVAPTQHEKSEWARLATAAYAARRNELGHRYSAAAALPTGAALPLPQFDALQAQYRAWLVAGFTQVVH